MLGKNNKFKSVISYVACIQTEFTPAKSKDVVYNSFFFRKTIVLIREHLRVVVLSRQFYTIMLLYINSKEMNNMKLRTVL